jgi:hypothetical protein
MFCLLHVGRKKKKKEKEEKQLGGLFPRAGDWTLLAGCAGLDFHSC